METSKTSRGKHGVIFQKFGVAWIRRTPTDQNLKPAKLLTVVGQSENPPGLTGMIGI